MNLISKYNTLKSMVVSDRKDSFNNLMNWIENNTEYLKSPASTKYHLCREQGLLEHSVSVVSTMIKIKGAICPEITNEQCIIVGLLHDLGKVGVPGSPQYLENEPTEKQKQYGYKANTPYRINDNLIFMTHAHRSIYLILPRFQLTEEECQAILMHDGYLIQDNQAYQFRESKLALLLHYADYWSCRYLEDTK